MVCRRESFEHLGRWLNECYQNCHNDDIEIMVVGMKCDLAARWSKPRFCLLVT